VACSAFFAVPFFSLWSPLGNSCAGFSRRLTTSPAPDRPFGAGFGPDRRQARGARGARDGGEATIAGNKEKSMIESIARLGRKLTPEELAPLFEVAPRTVREQYHRYGGVKVGRSVLFFENKVAEAIIGMQNALQGDDRWQEALAGAGVSSGREVEAETVRHEGPSCGLGIRNAQTNCRGAEISADPSLSGRDPFGLVDMGNSVPG